MVDGKTLVFIEVRLRRNHSRGGGAESVHTAKQRRIIRTAQVYLDKQYPVDQPACRFDVVAVNGDPQHGNLEWIKHAFDADE